MVLSTMMVLMLIAPTMAFAQQKSDAELLLELKQLVNDLRSELHSVAEGKSRQLHDLSRGIDFGDRGSDVARLQLFLINNGDLDARFQTGEYDTRTAQAFNRSQDRYDALIEKYGTPIFVIKDEFDEKFKDQLYDFTLMILEATYEETDELRESVELSLEVDGDGFNAEAQVEIQALINSDEVYMNASVNFDLNAFPFTTIEGDASFDIYLDEDRLLVKLESDELFEIAGEDYEKYNNAWIEISLDDLEEYAEESDFNEFKDSFEEIMAEVKNSQQETIEMYKNNPIYFIEEDSRVSTSRLSNGQSLRGGSKYDLIIDGVEDLLRDEAGLDVDFKAFDAHVITNDDDQIREWSLTVDAYIPEDNLSFSIGAKAFSNDRSVRVPTLPRPGSAAFDLDDIIEEFESQYGAPQARASDAMGVSTLGQIQMAMTMAQYNNGDYPTLRTANKLLYSEVISDSRYIVGRSTNTTGDNAYCVAYTLSTSIGSDETF